MNKDEFSHIQRPDYNSMDLEKETIMVYLTLGARTHRNDDERELLKEINQIKKDGYTVGIPSSGI